MSKTFAVATVIKTLEGNTLNEHLTLKIVRGQESRGDAFIKVFYEEKRTMYPGGGCYLASVLEVCPDDSTGVNDQLSAAIDRADRYEKALGKVQEMAKRGIFPHLPVETMGAQICIEIDTFITEALSPKTSSNDTK